MRSIILMGSSADSQAGVYQRLADQEDIEDGVRHRNQVPASLAGTACSSRDELFAGHAQGSPPQAASLLGRHKHAAQARKGKNITR